MRRDYEYFKNYRENMTFLKNTSKIVISTYLIQYHCTTPTIDCSALSCSTFRKKQLEARITLCWVTWR